MLGRLEGWRPEHCLHTIRRWYGWNQSSRVITETETEAEIEGVMLGLVSIHLSPGSHRPHLWGLDPTLNQKSRGWLSRPSSSRHVRFDKQLGF